MVVVVESCRGGGDDVKGPVGATATAACFGPQNPASSLCIGEYSTLLSLT